MARRNELPLAAGKRRGVHRKLHGNGGFVNGNVLQRSRRFRAGNGFSNGDSADARHRHNVSQLRLADVNPLQSVKRKQLRDLHRFQRTIELGYADFFAGAQRSIEHARNGKPPKIIAVVQICHQHLQHPGSISTRRGRGPYDRLEQRLQVVSGNLRIGNRCAQLRIGVQHRKFKLLFGGIQINK